MRTFPRAHWAVLLCLLWPSAGFGQDRVRLVVQLGHTSQVQCVAFSPDGRQVLTGDQDATRLWDASGGQELLALEIGAQAMTFSHDGKLVLTGHDDRTSKLWDAQTGKVLRTMEGHRSPVNSVAISQDGKYLLTSSRDHAIKWDAATGKQVKEYKGLLRSAIHYATLSPDGKYVLMGDAARTARLLDAESGRELHILRGHLNIVTSAAFSPDGKMLLTGSGDNTARLWDAAEGKLLHTFTGHTAIIYSVAFSPDGKHILTGSFDQTARLWEVGGKEVMVFKGHTERVSSVAFSADSKRVVTGCTDGAAHVWDAETGKELLQLFGRGHRRIPAALSRDGAFLLVASTDATARLWDARSGAEVRTLKGHTGRITAVAISPDSKRLLTGSEDHTARLWDAQSGKELLALKCPNDVMVVAFTADGKQLLTAGSDHALRLWDAANGKELHILRYPDSVIAVAIRADSKQVATGGNDGMARLFDVESGKELRNFKTDARDVSSVAISPDGKRLLTGDRFARRAHLWDAESGKDLQTVFGGNVAAFSADGKRFLTAAEDHSTRVFNTDDAKPQLTIMGRLRAVTGALFSEDGKHILTEDDLTRFWDARTGKEVCRLISFGDDGWAVLDPIGRYDASNGGDVKGLHWVVNNEPVALNQLKDHYYDPGLMAKLVGFRKEPPRNVKAVTEVKPYPELSIPRGLKSPKFTVGVTNSGGGIGRVVVRVNGKESIADARPAGAKADKIDVAVDLTNDPRVVPGRKNEVEVLAYNAAGDLVSRGLSREIDVPGEAASEPESLYAVIVGVSDFADRGISLNYAAKDAKDFRDALKLAAERKFQPERTHLTLLATVEGSQRPTRDSIRKALEALKASKPDDTVVVYLAGHGVTPGGPEGDWYYLTADARRTDLVGDTVKKDVSLSSDELSDLLRAVPAQKQVLILDTCHSGQVVDKVAERKIEQRLDVPGGQVRAVERVKDRTGMFVLAGCAADSVSYEATRYGQGLLTYSLLMGMKGGSKLHKDGGVGVIELFLYAADKVPELARDIGGVQKPTIASPRLKPFDIGQLTDADRERVPLQKVKPVVPRVVFQLEKPARDSLGLSKLVNERLQKASAEPRGAKLVFVDADDFPGGVMVSGRYKIDASKITVSVSLFEGDKELFAFTVEGAADNKDDLADKVAAEVEKRLAALRPN